MKKLLIGILVMVVALMLGVNAYSLSDHPDDDYNWYYGIPDEHPHVKRDYDWYYDSNPVDKYQPPPRRNQYNKYRQPRRNQRPNYNQYGDSSSCFISTITKGE